MIAALGVAWIAWLAVTVATGWLSQGGSCDGCHAMKPYAAAFESGPHSGLTCTRCHSDRGSVARVADGLAMQRRSASVVLGRPVSPARPSDRSCRRCHADIRLGVQVNRALRMSHEQVWGRSCLDCHAGTGHRLDDRSYSTALMEGCVTCHSSTDADPDGCDYCHVDEDASRVRTDVTPWQVTHGETWGRVHGMGDLSSCVSCHAPSYCATCHGVGMPHPKSWSVTHGDGLRVEARREKCESCHRSGWCDDCHGVPMPHGEGFLPRHGPIAERAAKGTCMRCHAEQACDDCHFRSAHPNIPGADRIHQMDVDQ